MTNRLLLLLAAILVLPACSTGPRGGGSDDDDASDDDDSADDDDATSDDDDATSDDDDATSDDDDATAADDDDASDDDDATSDDDDATADDDDATADDDDATPSSDDTIYEVQGGVHAPATLVTLEDVVVTGSSPAGFGIFVAEPSGGPYSGVWVFMATGSEAYGVGDLVDVTGYVEEYDGLGAWADTVTEINVGDYPAQASVTLIGGAAPPPPVLMSIGDVTDPSNAELYEGVLVQIDDVTVTADDLGFGEWSVDEGVRIDDKLYTINSVAFGDTFTSITGVLDFTFDNYKLAPRSESDFVGQTAAVWPADSLAPGELVINELMANPGLGCVDADDEYLELRYLGSGPADLQGLVVTYGSNSAEIQAPTPVTYGDFVLLVREDPSPCYGHAGTQLSLQLTNSGSLIGLWTPSSVAIDEVDMTGWSIPNGSSLGLDPAVANASDNDSAANWCLATSPLVMDFGTPGVGNDSCAP